MSRSLLALFLLLSCPLTLGAQPYDLLLKGGHLLDPKNEINARMDVAIAGGKVARVDEDLPTSRAKKTIDVSGLYVTPGFVDLHTHIVIGSGLKGTLPVEQNVYVDSHTLRSGVTTAVDAGTSGWRDFPDFGAFRPERPFEEMVLDKLRPGDMYTHTYHGSVPMLDDTGKVREYLFQARKRGVKFDVGHGAGSFWWRQAVPAVKQGFLPDSISTDLHVISMNQGMKDMTNVMSKFLNLGVPLYEVVKRSTIHPALQIKRPELGHLTVGAVADIAVLRMEEGRFGFLDVRNARLDGTKRLRCELTLREGHVVWDLNGLAGEDWKSFYGVE